MYSFYQGILFLYLIYNSNANINCGDKVITESSGYIASPGFPDGLPKAGSCKWKIFLEPSDYLTISFETFQFPSRSVVKSSLAISSGLGGNGRIQYTGSSPPVEPYISALHDSVILISMIVDQQDISARFNFTFIKGPISNTQVCPSHQFKCDNGKCILSRWVCNGFNECENGSDEALCNVPSSTPHEGSCPSHHFTCISSSTGHLSCFQEIRKCDGHPDCENGDDEESCMSICQYQLKGTAGWFSSPNYPGRYYSNLDCEWRISLEEEGIVQLRFLFFQLETNFYMDYVTVIDEYIDHSTGVTKQNVIGTYHGSSQGIYSPPTVVESSGSSLIVQFHTDTKVNLGGFNATFQKKGYCIDDQKSCGEDDNNCYDVEREMCDGRYACQRGQDEVGCGNCSAERIPCQPSGSDCFDPNERCNGFTTCKPGGEDEKFCTAEICGESRGLFLCKDGSCIQEKWICDIQMDCKDGSDESDCMPTNKVVTAAVIGSLVCGMLLVAALSCTCKLYQLRNIRRGGPSHSPYYIYGRAQDQREAPPSYSATMASPHYAELQRAFVEGAQDIHGSSHSTRGVSRRRSRFLRMLSHNSQLDPTLATLPEAARNGNSSDGRAGLSPSQGIQNTDNLPIDPENAVESSSFTTSDTDSESTQEVVQSHQILNAAANIHRMRVANRMLQQSGRNDPAVSRTPINPPSDGPETSVSSTSDAQNDTTPSSSSTVTPELSSTSQDQADGQDTHETVEETPPPRPIISSIPDEGESQREHEPAIIVGVDDPLEDGDDVQLLDDI